MKKIYYKNIPTNRKTKLVANMVQQYEELNKVLTNLRGIIQRNPEDKTYKNIYSRKLSEWSIIYRLLQDNGIAPAKYLED